MATQKQRETSRENIKKAQAAWRSMSSKQHSRAQPEGRSRAKTGTTGEGEYFRIVVRPKEEFRTFRYHDIGKEGHVQRLAGRRQSGSWDTQAWLISKNDAHLEGNRLIADTQDAKQLIEELGSSPKHVKADIFEAKDRPSENIRKAQEARRG